ncbi:MAG: GTP 3',8-cyclase MoaA [Flavobacteriales bacterium]|nr:GTP 3',8-cyclase MoaA [Flavobacteriales bacterium]
MDLLVDSFGRRHDYLRMSLTERCNLRCFYCMPEEGIPLRDKAHFMRDEEVFRIAETFVRLGVKKIRLTGGEPLVRRGAGEIIRALGTLPVELAVTTNGILIDQHIDALRDAGVRAVNVSLDSLKEQRQAMISRRNYFDRIMTNIRMLLNENFHLKINVVVMKGVNDDELVDFVELTRDRPVHIRFIEFMPFQGNQWNWAKGVGYEEMVTAIRTHYGETSVSRLMEKPNETAKCFGVRGYAGSFGVISSVTHPFCNTCNRIRITADGKMKNCLFSSSETDLLTPLRNGEDIVPPIVRSIVSKYAQRGGMDVFTGTVDPRRIDKNRSMVAIGG